MFALSLLLTLAGGSCVAFQSATNANLQRRTGKLQTTVISFTGGVALLTVLVLLFGKGDLLAITNATWWKCTGGFLGVFFVMVTPMCAPHLGMALMLTFMMLGQLFMGMLIDGFGWFGTSRVVIESMRVAGCALVAFGIALVYIGKKQNEGDQTKKGAAGYALLSFLSGVAIAIQSPINAALGAVVGRVESAFWSFVIGWVSLCVALIVKRKTAYTRLRGSDVRPWMCIGGLYGVVNVFANIYATPVLGVTLVMAVSMLGVLACGLLIDTYGLLQTPKIPLNRYRVGGVISCANGVILVTLQALHMV